MKRKLEACLCMECMYFSNYINPYNEERESYCSNRRSSVNPTDYKCLSFKEKKRYENNTNN